MAYEIKPWKREGCVLTLRTSSLSGRETFSREINEAYGEGGGLNANYQTVEALARAANILGVNGFNYGEDFIFKTGGLDSIGLDFSSFEIMDRAKKILKKFMA